MVLDIKTKSYFDALNQCYQVRTCIPETGFMGMDQVRFLQIVVDKTAQAVANQLVARLAPAIDQALKDLYPDMETPDSGPDTQGDIPTA